MSSLPETKYAKSGDVSIAYQVVGDGPLDLVFVSGWAFPMESSWDFELGSRFVKRLASFARLIQFDKRGTGLSDRVRQLPSLEERMDDLRAVLDAVGSRQAAFFGVSEGGPLSILYAATYPKRTSGLVLFGSIARMTPAPTYPWGMTDEEIERLRRYIDTGWGAGKTFSVVAPSAKKDQAFHEWASRAERSGASPSAARDLFDMNLQIDVRHVLPAVRVPTLVLHRREDRLIDVGHGRYLAEAIPGARYVELAGEDHMPQLGDPEAVLAEIQEFLTGTRKPVEHERVLATVLFTDIVRSTEHAGALGDHRWREALDSHDELTAREIERLSGRLIKTTGDGVLATFDGPARAIKCASAVRDGVRNLGLEIRAGLHTGEVEVRGDDIAGIAVHIAARVLGKAQPGEVLVSRTLTDLVAGSDLRFENRGEHALEGVTEKWQLFAAAG